MQYGKVSCESRNIRDEDCIYYYLSYLQYSRFAARVKGLNTTRHEKLFYIFSLAELNIVTIFILAVSKQ